MFSFIFARAKAEVSREEVKNASRQLAQNCSLFSTSETLLLRLDGDNFAYSQHDSFGR